MSKNDKERLVDKVMGEAVMSLLEADDNVSFDALLSQLQESLHDENDHGRREAFRTAINGVHQFRMLPDSGSSPSRSLKLHRRDAVLSHPNIVYKH
ncbi:MULTISPECIES: hypothetical protein [Enterobacteriaceae]|jgi:hypothetical protein|uniref:hypothetical protein n=1 Tax=Enterobacteriaceae TaxID=543 RepID=UPI0011A8CD8E|nr:MULTISPECIES: hypothetical protein [Enterobacteriaceae]MCR4457394.1 hypothetical protein [Pseudescherichia sp. L3]MDF2779913.1 hypothetical protein [Enterobacteriaceae bacterium]